MQILTTGVFVTLSANLGLAWACLPFFPVQGHEEMTIEEIMLGKGDYYPGLVPLVYAYLGHIGCDADTMDTVDQVRLRIVATCWSVDHSPTTAKCYGYWLQAPAFVAASLCRPPAVSKMYRTIHAPTVRIHC